jgi:hypothetical protein
MVMTGYMAQAVLSAMMRNPDEASRVHAAGRAFSGNVYPRLGRDRLGTGIFRDWVHRAEHLLEASWCG